MQKLMKTLFAMSIVFCFIGTPQISAQEHSPITPATEAPVGPISEIDFDHTSFDFGTIQEGEIVTHVFTFTNVGDEPLIVVNARGSCGCTVPQWPKEPILPGETASFTVKFNSKNKKGKRNQKVTITTNTEPPHSYLYLTGTIIPESATLESIENAEVDSSVKEIKEDCFTIFPNPTAEVFSVKIEETFYGKPVAISIFSEAGQLMARKEVLSISETIKFDVNHYPPGIYTAVVKIGENTTQSQCFVVME